MVGYGCGVVVGDGKPAFLVEEVADEGRVEDETLRAHLFAGHALGEGSNFGGGERGVPDANFSYAPIHVRRRDIIGVYKSTDPDLIWGGEINGICSSPRICAV